MNLLEDAFNRVREAVHDAVDGLSPDALNTRLSGDANSIAWLAWHLTRIQDDHIAHVAGHEQAWTSRGWFERFALPLDPSEHGYGHSAADVDKVRVESAELLTAYYDDVHQQTIDYVHTLTDDDLDRVIDTSWDPPVTLGVRLVSVIADDLQHAGQAAFVRRLL